MRPRSAMLHQFVVVGTSAAAMLVLVTHCALPGTKGEDSVPPRAEIVEDPSDGWRVEQSAIEEITNEASITTTDGETNGWGGHQTRIVRTSDGVFAAWMKNTDDPQAVEWCLARRANDGTWPVLARGPSGLQPVNLLAAPDGTLHVVAWQNNELTCWSGKLTGTTLTMTPEKPTLPSQGQWAYGAAGISAEGDLCALGSEGGWSKDGRMMLAMRKHGATDWMVRELPTNYRHCYAYVFPGAANALTISATRDTKWESLGFPVPPGSNGYAFNAFSVWQSPDTTTTLPLPIHAAEEPPTRFFPDAVLNPQMDAYLDTEQKLHLLYTKRGGSTGGIAERRHRIIGKAGEKLHDGLLPDGTGEFNRLFQSASGKFYLLSSRGFLIPLGNDGHTAGKPERIDLGGHQVQYSGFTIAVPRSGTPRSDVIDVVFPSESWKQWLYFELKLHEGTE